MVCMFKIHLKFMILNTFYIKVSVFSIKLLKNLIIGEVILKVITDRVIYQPA